MKNLFLPLFLLVLFTGCKNTYSDIELNTNPYDEAYEGPKVARIGSCRTIPVTIGSSTVPQTEVHVFPTTDLYQQLKLYRNGVHIKTMNRHSYAPVNPSETIMDEHPVTGITYSYEVSLTSDQSETQLSDAYDHLTQL